MNKKKILLISGITAAAIIIAITILLLIFLPNNSTISLFDGVQYKAVVNGEVRTDVKNIGGERYFSFDLVKAAVDKYIWMDRSGKIITITNSKGITRLSFDDETKIAIENQTVYIKESFVADFYDVTFDYNNENNISIIINDELCIGDIIARTDSLNIRSGPSIKEPRVKVIENKNGETVAKLLEEAHGKWMKIMTLTGETGYVKESDVEIIENENYTGRFSGVNVGSPGSGGAEGEPEFKKIFKNRKINMVWEAVYNSNPDVSTINDMKGLNVIAPTWFELVDATGETTCKADMEYVEWAHSRGYYVWGTIVSLSDCDMTSNLLSDHEARKKYIEQIVGWAKEYRLDGINIDFEYMYEEDKMLFTQFVRELSALCHMEGMVISCDVTALSNSPKWSLCYDRESLAEVVDYMCVMFYDQYSGGGAVSGSVAQLAWVEKSLNAVLEQIPNDKLILGMPFYTRLWEEKTIPGSETEVTSKVFNMSDADEWILANNITAVWDEESGQHYAEYKDGNSVYRLWIEDETSIGKRVDLVNKYDLAGCAAWRRGFEKEEIWTVISEKLK